MVQISKAVIAKFIQRNIKSPISDQIANVIVSNCNSILESTLTIGSSSKCQLKLYLPNGLDTVKAAEYITMTLLHKDTAKNISIYYAEYIFHKSGIQDNIEYVDGYMYLDVYSPVTVQRDIPLQFDFLIS